MSQSLFVYTQLNGFKYCYPTLIILFAHVKLNGFTLIISNTNNSI